MTAAVMHPPKALVLFSGGQDSTTCLAWALSQFAHVETIGFDYGQRHRIEMDVRLDTLRELRNAFPEWSDRLGDDHAGVDRLHRHGLAEAIRDGQRPGTGAVQQQIGRAHV